MANESIKAGFQRLWEHTINKIEERVEKEEGKGLSTNDFTDEYKNKVDYTTGKIGIQPDWNQNDETALDYVKNRTHWIEKNPEIILFEEHEVPRELSNEQHPPYILSTPFLPEVGQDYVIKINNDKIFYSTAYQEDDRVILPLLTDNGLQFGAIEGQYVYYREGYPQPSTIDIIITTPEEKIYKIDEKFLPKQNILNGESSGSVRTVATNTNIGVAAFAEGYKTTASGNNSHAEGYNTIASGNSSHAEGTLTTAFGENSHAEGLETEASGYASHAEGWRTIASNENSHAEGCETTASGEGSHAEGEDTIASGNYSHAEGYYTIASSQYQHVQGKYNIENKSGTYAHIVGNGTATTRSNAHTLDWNGNAWFKGKITLGTDNKEVAIKDDVTALSELIANPDWNVHDSNNPAYIKNRTHYIERKPSTEIFPETVLSDNVLSSDGPIGIVSGEIYIVKFNNGLYPCKASQVMIDSLNCIAIGNLSIIESGIDSGQPFCIVELSDEETAKLLGYDIILLQTGISSPTVGIYESEECVHKLYGKYMPDGYPYIDQLEVLPETIITLDENDAVGPLTDTLDITPGNSYTVIWNGTEYTVTAQEMTEEAISAIILGNLGAVMGNGNTGEPFVVLYAPDMYADLGFTGMVMDISGAGATEAKIAIYAGNGEIHTMDPRFIPDMYYEENLGKTYLSYSGTLLRENETDLKVEVETPSVNIDADLAYTVTFNGVQYPDIVGTPSEIDGTPIIEFRITLDNGDEVSIQTINGMGFMIAVSEATPTNVETYDCVCTVETVGMLIHKIDKKYLPDDVGGSSIKNLEDGSSHGSIRMIDSAVENNDYTMGESAFAEGYQTKASGDYSHAEGYYTEASGIYSHAEGYWAKATGIYSHAEGNYTEATGDYGAHAEGDTTHATGTTSHAEGQYSTASGDYSHAEGNSTTAAGMYSHAEGYHTKASSNYQHAQGRYNIEDTEGKYAHIVGNGQADGAKFTYSNAHTLDWEGNAWFQGDVYINSTSGTNKDEGSKKLATEEFVTQKVAEINIETPTEYESIILKSSVSGSTKKFRLTIDDDGVLSVEKVVL